MHPKNGNGPPTMGGSLAPRCRHQHNVFFFFFFFPFWLKQSELHKSQTIIHVLSTMQVLATEQQHQQLHQQQPTSLEVHDC
jgi:hypothetical protein